MYTYRGASTSALLAHAESVRRLSDNEHRHLEELFSRFQHAIKEHHTEHREVRYYAQLLGLSTKYFSSVIMSLTNTRPIDWINGYVMVQAKLLLDSKKELSIQQIGQKLGFAHQAAFSRFFKAYAHVTPTEYRERSSDSC